MLRPFQDFAPSYIDDVFDYSRSMNVREKRTWNCIDTTFGGFQHLCASINVGKPQSVYIAIRHAYKSCILLLVASKKIQLVGCIVGKHGVLPDLKKKDQDYHRMAFTSRCQGTSKVTWLSDVLAQVLARVTPG